MKNISEFIKMMLGLVLISLLLVGCNNSRLADAEKFVEQVKQKPHPPIEPIPAFPEEKGVKYSSSGYRSPFSPTLTTMVNLPDLNRPKEELEAYALETLKLVGIITQGTKRWAFILAPNNMVYKATIGSHMGQNYGKIVDISLTKVTLVEKVPDGMGSWKERQMFLTLPG